MSVGSVPAAPVRVSQQGRDRVVLEDARPEGRVRVITGFAGPALPPRLSVLRLEPVAPGRWRMSAAEGEFEFGARAVEVLDPRPDLFTGLLAPYALRRRERLLVRALLKLLRLPGGAWLLRRWHARRR